MDNLQFYVVSICGTGGILLSMLGQLRYACLVGALGQPYWLMHTWNGPLQYFIVAVAATAAYAVGILLHWVLPWWNGRSERARRTRRTSTW